MELDDLKYQLKNKLATDHAGMSQADIAALLTKKTISITDKLKRSLWIEIVFGILIVLGFLFIGISASFKSVGIYFSVFGVMCLAFVVLLVYLLRRISHLSAHSLPVKGNLQTIVNIIEEFMKRYFQFTMVLIPVCLVFSVFLGFTEKQPLTETGPPLAKSLSGVTWQVISFLIAYTVALSIGIYYFTKWYLRKLYGKYIAQLKDCIAELGE